MKIIAFGYKKGVGKDTIGKFLMTQLRIRHPGLNVQHVSFAAKLKDICFQLYGWAGLERGVYYETHRNKKEVILPKLGMSPRANWIEVGNKLREVYKDTWIDFALKGVKADVIVITDCGFINEAIAIKKAGGFLCKVQRDGLPQGTDAREVELDTWHDWDYVVNNESTLEQLNQTAEMLATGLMRPKKI
jgi:hypothetical protein